MPNTELYRKLHEAGLSISEIAQRLGVSRQAVHRAVRKKPKGGWVQRFLSSLQVDVPIVVDYNYVQRDYLYKVAKQLKIQIVTKDIEIDGEQKLWIIRLS